jgi:hypothetical protein
LDGIAPEPYKSARPLLASIAHVAAAESIDLSNGITIEVATERRAASARCGLAGT